MKGIFQILILIAFCSIGVSAFPQYTVKQADSILSVLSDHIFNDYKKELQLAEEVITVYKESGDTCRLIEGILIRVDVELVLSHFEASLASIIEAQNLFNSSGCELQTQTRIYARLAEFYQYVGEGQKSDSMAMLGIRMFQDSWEDKPNLIKLYLLFARTSKPINEVKPYLDTALNLALTYNEKILEQKILNNIGTNYAIHGDYEEALEYFKMALVLAKEQNDFVEMSKIYNNLAGLSSDTDIMLLYLDSAIFYAYESKSLDDLQTFTENKAYFYSMIGEYEKGYDQLWNAMLLKDSLLNIKKIEAIAEIEQKYEAEKKTNEIQSLKVQMLNTEVENLNYRKNQITLFVGLAILLILAGSFAFGFVVARRHKNKLAVKNIEIDTARKLSDELLLNILPAEIAEELKLKGTAKARKYDLVTILFTDFKEFTQTAEKLSASDLVDKINYCFKGFDEIMEKYGVEKIKTIGDAYMAAGGIPVRTNNFVKNTILAALEMQRFIQNRKEELVGSEEPAFEMRVGIHTGPVVAGIVGVKKFQYDVWGDTVNTASRMENHSEVGRVNISGDTYKLIQNDPDFTLEYRGKIDVKGKGAIDMYYVGLA